MKRILTLPVFFILIFFQCQTTHDSSFILGKWQDENSIVAYLPDGKWEGLSGSEVIATGTWRIENDVLHMHIDRSGNNYSYKILSKSKDAFSIQSLGDDKKVFNKKRL